MPARHTANSYSCSLCGTVYRDALSVGETAFERASACEERDRKQAEDKRLEQTTFERNGRATRANMAEVEYLRGLVAIRDIKLALDKDTESATKVVDIDFVLETVTLDVAGKQYTLRLESK